jgi:hypothetical protein
MMLFSLKKCMFLLEYILDKRAALIPEKMAVCFESIMVDLSRWFHVVNFRRVAPGIDRFLVQMVLFSPNKREFLLEYILYKRAALIPEKWPYVLRASWSTCHGGFILLIFDVRELTNFLCKWCSFPRAT